MTLTTQLKSWGGSVIPMGVPILGGSLRGYQWLPASRGKLLRMLLGTYEPELTQWLAATLTEGSVVFDVGANAGYYTLLCSKLVGPNGRVVAFEPVPEIAAICRKHVAINRARNVLVYECAAGDTDEHLAFETRCGTGRGRVSEEGNLRVPSRRLDDVAADLDLRPSFIKIDVEGYGYEVLCGARQILRSARPAIILSTHGRQEVERSQELLDEMGYTVSKCGPDLHFQHRSPQSGVQKAA
jgi:FkbM family methyltransferase